MPQAIDITVNNGGTTPVSKTFALVTPAAGDGGIAMWALKEGTISAVFPTLTASASKTSNGSRKLQLKFRLPSSYSDPVTGLTNVGPAAEFNATFSIPNVFPESLKNDWTAFTTNLINDSLVKALIRDAYPAT